MSTTIRRRRPRFEFVQMLNAVIRDYRVSWRARGLLTELLSYPEGYETTVDELVKKAKRSGGKVEGRDAMRAASRELKNVGYIVETKYQNELGHWITEQEVTDDPMYDILRGGSGVSAGHTGDGFPGVGSPGVGKPGVGSPGVIKKTETNTEKKTDGDGGVSRVRASDETSPGDEPQWGVTGGRSELAPTRLSADLIASVADKVLLKSEGLDVDEHKLLAGLADTARGLIEDMSGLSWEEYTAWLHQGWVHPDGTRAFRAFFGTFKWRLLAEQITKHALPWAQERRAAQKPSEAQGGREETPPTRTPGDVADKSTCGVHGTTTLDGRCLPCDREAAEEERRLQEEEQRAAEEADAAEAEEGQEPVSEEDAAMATKMMEELRKTEAAAAERAKKEREATRRKMEELRKAAERDRLERAF